MKICRPTGSATALVLASGVLFGACGGSGPSRETAPEALDDVSDAVVTSNLKPTSDVVKTGVTGVGSTTSLFQNVDDGTAFTSADNDTTYVHSGTNSSAVHRVGYSGAATGTVTQVVANYRAR